MSSAYWEGANLREVGPSRFWVAGRRVPEPNQDAVRVAPAFRFLPHSFTESAWQQEERERLREGILQAVKVRGQQRLTPCCTGMWPHGPELTAAPSAEGANHGWRGCS